ncbi:MAG: hypothetical protein H6644_14540 [Caldilineaceae bacterium]|nr:hypothetical protein [Caldilineaceae bacterium]
MAGWATSGAVDARRGLGPRHFGQQRPAAQRPQQGVDARHHVTEDGLTVEQLPAHPPPLRALPGEDEDDRCALCFGVAGHQRRGINVAAQIRAQVRLEVGAPVAHDHKPVLVVCLARPAE